jgi:hypothetical protein
MGRKKADPRPDRPALVAHTQRDILVQVATTLQHASDSLRMMQETQANMLAATRVLAEQVDDCQASVDRLDGSVRVMSDNIATINGRLAMRQLSDAESARPGSPPSQSPPFSTDTPAEVVRKRRLQRLTDWYKGLGLTVKILVASTALVGAAGALVLALWKYAAIFDHRVPPPPVSSVFMGPPSPAPRGPK